EQKDRFDIVLQLANTLSDRGELLRRLNRLPEADKAYRRSLYLEGKLGARIAAYPERRQGWIEVSYHLGSLALFQGDLKEARRLLEGALRCQREWPAAERPPNYAVQLGAAYAQLLDVLRRLGDHAAETRQALEMTRDFPKGLREHLRAGSCFIGCGLRVAQD